MTKCVLELRIPFEAQNEEAAREITKLLIQKVADLMSNGEPDKIEGALMLNLPRLPE